MSRLNARCYSESLNLFWSHSAHYSYATKHDVIFIETIDALYGECSHIEEKAVYINIILGKTVQWK